MIERMREVFYRVLVKNKCELVECNGEPDHIHLLIDLHPDNNISRLISSLKSASSRIIRAEFAEQVGEFYYRPVFWSSSYYVASAGGAPINRLKSYIQSQDAPAPGD